ncbi:MAG: HEAT repeat domain-containing protein [Armatimonadota bacterium]
MVRTVVFGALVGLLGSHAAAQYADEVARILDEFRAVDWDNRARMRKGDPHDEAWRIRVRAEHALIRMGAVRDLIAALEDRDRHVRALATLCLGAIGDASALKPLMRALSEDADATVRVYAAEAIGRLGDPRGVEALTAALDDASANVVFAARIARQRLTDGPPCGDTLRKAVHRQADFDGLKAPRVGDPAPEIDLVSDEGQRVRLSSFRGRGPVVVLFQLADW